MNEEQRLEEIRGRIDELDKQIQELISQRAEAALEVAEVKKATGSEVRFYRADREALVLRRVAERNRGPLNDNGMMTIFREIMSACLALEQSLSVAFLGPEGTFTQDAAVRHFGHAVDTCPLGAIDEVFREVESGACAYGVVPVENSTEGVISRTQDMFLHSSLKICGEVQLRIHHNLLSREKDVSRVQVVYSHQQSLAQCREWLDRNLPGVRRVAVPSNAYAARKVAERTEPGAAAVAGLMAAERYGVPVLVSNIEDQPDNTTRFLVLGRHDVGPTGVDRTSLLISAANRPGALYRLLQPFSERGISLSRVESRPARNETWGYVFFVDVIGHVEQPEVAEAIEALRAEAAMVKVLGSYPQAMIR